MGPMANATGLAEGEESVLKVHQHWKTVLWPVLVLAATVVALLVLLLFLPKLAATARLALGAIALIVVWAAVALSYQTNWPVGFFVGTASAAAYATGRAWRFARRNRATA